ncbi:MAG: hypothetical protein KDD69_18110, partial [Bdellovibrionales bacterium]|nr:hypothetical protein [Bdellovibrionales bacterium]
RMAASSEHPNVFIRSMASRGALGGLAPRTAEAVFACDAAGFDVVILETVGVGQAEVEVVKTADTVVVVLVPGLGDSVQALKAGLMEIADVFAINKADYPGADRLQKEIVQMLSLGGTRRRPTIVQTIADKGDGIEGLLAATEAHRLWAIESGAREARRDQFLKNMVENQFVRTLARQAWERATEKGMVDEALAKLRGRQTAPGAVVDALLKAATVTGGS